MAKSKAATQTEPKQADPAEQFKTAEHKAERILTELAQSGQDWPTPEQWPLFDSLGWTKEQVGRAVRRTAARVRWQAVAGNVIERDRAETRLEDAKEKMAAEMPDIEQAVAEMTAKAESLRQVVAEAEKEVSTRTDAVEHVRHCLPYSVVKHVERSIAALKRESRSGDGYQKKCQRRGLLKGVVTWELEHIGKVVSNAQVNEEAALRKYLAKNDLSEADWPNHRAELVRELEELESEFGRREMEYEVKKQAIETMAITPYIG
ncbi:MAG: hypothetical protein HQ582_31735 [Planctomycetes bacterium]|nr:hypothetical protein [Planctomycetota bacterium]